MLDGMIWEAGNQSVIIPIILRGVGIRLISNLNLMTKFMLNVRLAGELPLINRVWGTVGAEPIFEAFSVK